MYKVLCESSYEEDSVVKFEYELDAEHFISKQLEWTQNFYSTFCSDYDYRDCYDGDGHLVTAIKEIDNDGWACWTRLWT